MTWLGFVLLVVSMLALWPRVHGHHIEKQTEEDLAPRGDVFDYLLERYLTDDLTIEEYELRVGALLGVDEDRANLRHFNVWGWSEQSSISARAVQAAIDEVSR